MRSRWYLVPLEIIIYFKLFVKTEAANPGKEFVNHQLAKDEIHRIIKRDVQFSQQHNYAASNVPQPHDFQQNNEYDIPPSTSKKKTPYHPENDYYGNYGRINGGGDPSSANNYGQGRVDPNQYGQNIGPNYPDRNYHGLGNEGYQGQPYGAPQNNPQPMYPGSGNYYPPSISQDNAGQGINEYNGAGIITQRSLGNIYTTPYPYQSQPYNYYPGMKQSNPELKKSNNYPGSEEIVANLKSSTLDPLTLFEQKMADVEKKRQENEKQRQQYELNEFLKPFPGGNVTYVFTRNDEEQQIQPGKIPGKPVSLDVIKKAFAVLLSHNMSQHGNVPKINNSVPNSHTTAGYDKRYGVGNTGLSGGFAEAQQQNPDYGTLGQQHLPQDRMPPQYLNQPSFGDQNPYSQNLSPQNQYLFQQGQNLNQFQDTNAQNSFNQYSYSNPQYQNFHQALGQNQGYGLQHLYPTPGDAQNFNTQYFPSQKQSLRFQQPPYPQNQMNQNPKSYLSQKSVQQNPNANVKNIQSHYPAPQNPGEHNQGPVDNEGNPQNEDPIPKDVEALDQNPDSQNLAVADNHDPKSQSPTAYNGSPSPPSETLAKNENTSPSSNSPQTTPANIDYDAVSGWYEQVLPSLDETAIPPEAKIISSPTVATTYYKTANPLTTQGWLIEKAYQTMVANKLGYLTGFLYQLFIILSQKSADSTRDLFAAGKKVCNEWVKSGKFSGMGQPSQRAFQYLFELLTSWSHERIKSQTEAGALMIKNMKLLLTEDTINITKIMDNSFIVYGDQLFKTLEEVDAYSPTSGQNPLEVVTHVGEALLLPYLAAHVPSRDKLFQSINTALINTFHFDARRLNKHSNSKNNQMYNKQYFEHVTIHSRDENFTSSDYVFDMVTHVDDVNKKARSEDEKTFDKYSFSERNSQYRIEKDARLERRGIGNDKLKGIHRYYKQGRYHRLELPRKRRIHNTGKNDTNFILRKQSHTIEDDPKNEENNMYIENTRKQHIKNDSYRSIVTKKYTSVTEPLRKRPRVVDRTDRKGIKKNFKHENQELEVYQNERLYRRKKLVNNKTNTQHHNKTKHRRSKRKRKIHYNLKTKRNKHNNRLTHTDYNYEKYLRNKHNSHEDFNSRKDNTTKLDVKHNTFIEIADKENGTTQKYNANIDDDSYDRQIRNSKREEFNVALNLKRKSKYLFPLAGRRSAKKAKYLSNNTVKKKIDNDVRNITNDEIDDSSLNHEEEEQFKVILSDAIRYHDFVFDNY